MTILLASQRLRLWLDPDEGVAWRALQGRRGDDWVSLVPDCRRVPDHEKAPRAGQDEAAPLSAACFQMLPYSNRIRDGRFSFKGHEHQLGRPDAHAIHGALRGLPWRVEQLSAERALCRFDSRLHDAHVGQARVDWPWPIEATLEHALDGATLTSRISLTNRGDTPMPAGFGWHPYFVRDIDGAGPELTLPVDAVYPDADGDCLPDGPAVPLPSELDFRQARRLDPQQPIDCCLAGLSGDVRIAWPGADIALTMSASPVCTHAVLYNPAKPHFAVEPVTNANDAFNLAEAGIDAGRRVLLPGETLSAALTLLLHTD